MILVLYLKTCCALFARMKKAFSLQASSYIFLFLKYKTNQYFLLELFVLLTYFIQIAYFDIKLLLMKYVETEVSDFLFC